MAAQKDTEQSQKELRVRGLSTASLVGRQLDGKWKLRKVCELWLLGVGLCLVTGRQSGVELCSPEDGVELLWSGETC